MPETIPETANVSQLAALIGIGREHVYKHIRRSQIQPDTHKRYPVRPVLEAIHRHRQEDNRKIPTTGPKAEKMRLEAEILRLKLERLEGELDDDVRRLAFETSRKARDRLLQIPDRLAPVLAGLDTAAACYQTLLDEIETACHEIAETLGAPSRARRR